MKKGKFYQKVNLIEKENYVKVFQTVKYIIHLCGVHYSFF